MISLEDDHMLNSQQSNSFKKKVHGHFLSSSGFAEKKKKVDLKYCTKEGSRDGGDIPKISDNTGIGMSNIDNVIE